MNTADHKMFDRMQKCTNNAQHYYYWALNQTKLNSNQTFGFSQFIIWIQSNQIELCEGTIK